MEDSVPRHSRAKGGETDEDQKEGQAERVGQTPGGEVLGPDEVRGFWQAMLQLKEVKESIIAGSAIQTYDFFIQWHLTERCNLRCRHCYQRPKRPLEMTAGDVCNEIDGAV